MDDTNIERILENMMYVMPVFHRKLLRMDLGGVTDNLTRLHFAIMGVLSNANMTMTELAKMMKSEGMDIFAANKKMKLISEEKMRTLLKAENLLKLGYTLDELMGGEG